jgi:hypothetical protein
VTKNHRPHDVPLAPEAVAVIRSLPIITAKSDKGEDKSELVFTTTGTTPWSGFSKLKRQIDEQIAKQTPRTAASRWRRGPCMTCGARWSPA